MRSECNCSDLTEVQIAQGDHYDDCPDSRVPPLEQPPLQSLSEVESTRLEEEDYEQS